MEPAAAPTRGEGGPETTGEGGAAAGGSGEGCGAQGAAGGAAYVGHGHRGTVTVRTERLGDGAVRSVATKARRGSAPPHAMRREAEFLRVVNRHGIGPRLLGAADDGESVRYEYVRGLPILEHIQQPAVNREHVLDILQQVFVQLHVLDTLRLNKHEMTWPAEHILVERAPSGRQGAVAPPEAWEGWRPVLIDFERCTADAAKPRNVTQFLQFLATPTVSGILAQKRVGVDVALLRRWGGGYRKRLLAESEGGPGGGEAAAWDFVGELGLREVAVGSGGAAAAQAGGEPGAPPRGRAARRLEAKRARARESGAAAAGTANKRAGWTGPT